MKTDKSVSNISKSLCCGCMACGDVCSKDAITFPIENGFWYPKVDSEKCVNCGLCQKKCPVLTINKERESKTIDCYGAKTRNEDIRWHSTSGGFFTELGQHWIEEGGIVIGAAYDEDCNIYHYIGKTVDDIARLRQSKYAQSNTSGIYKSVKSLLTEGNKVLFCGTPCQVEALYSYLGKRHDSLLTMDFFCLGICSPWVYRKYLEMLEAKYKSKAVKVWFKNKTNGWRSISNRIDFANGKTYIVPGGRDPFMRAFVVDALSMRPNCENCQFRNTHHVSDFTVGDFWGLEKVNPAVDDNKGMSAIFVNSEKARNIFNAINGRLDYFSTTIEDIVRDNFSVVRPLKTNQAQSDFIACVEREGFMRAIFKYSSYTRKEDLKFKLRDLKGFIKYIVKK